MLKDMSTGSWAEYLVDVPATGQYDLCMHIACKSGSKIEVYEDDVLVATLQPTATSSEDFDHWQTQSFPVNLTAGQHRIKLLSKARLYYYEWLSIGQPTAIENHKSDIINHKSIINGQLVITTPMGTYNTIGTKIN